MLTGDSLDMANNVQGKLGPIDVPAQLFLEDKVELLKQLKAANLFGMVGDEINDAPTLATANVGIAMGVAEAEPWCPKKMEDNRVSAHGTKQENEYYLSYCATKSCCDVRGANNVMRQRVNNRDACEKYCQCIAIDEGLLVSSDATDVGSEDFSSKEGRHVEVESAPIRHLDEHEDERDMILQYYSEEWGHSKESGQMDVTGRSNLDLGPLAHLGVWALKFASVLGKDFGGWAKTKEVDDSVWEDAEDGSETPFFFEKDFKEAFSEMASGENLANFDSFPSSEEGPFKFNMIGNFGRQKVCTDVDHDYNLISRNGERVSPVHLGIKLHMSLDQEEVQVHAVDSSPLSKESKGLSAENKEALFSNIEVCKPETEAGHGRWLCVSQLMDPLIEQRSTLKAQAKATALILSNGKKLHDELHEGPGLEKGKGLGPSPRKSQGLGPKLKQMPNEATPARANVKCKKSGQIQC
ncbi:hypothetical protein L7F22_030635 [Adiantum nelumboides]|nr:hypothetical protein [Adiantum nelumboides]